MFDLQATNVTLALQHASLLRQFRSLSPQANIDQVLRLEMRDRFASAYLPPTANGVAAYYGGNNVRKILYIDGVDRMSQAQGLISGYGEGESLTSFAPLNPWIADNAANILAWMSTSHQEMPEYLDVVGYSAGGAIAIDIRKRFSDMQALWRTKTITFGAPRTGDRRYRAALSRATIVRWFTDADPVPLLPPRGLDVPALLAVVPTLRLIRWGNYVHTDGGISIAQNGVTTPAVLPPVSSINTAGSLVDWFFGLMTVPNNPHDLTTYVAYLQSAVALLPRVDEQNVESGAEESAVATPRAEMTRAQRAAQDSIVNAGHEQNQGPLVAPAEAFIKARRLGRIWVVDFAGRIIAQAPAERRARAIARAGNAFLRGLPRQALVDPEALIEQLGTFLVLASSPTGGFAPQINTRIE